MINRLLKTGKWIGASAGVLLLFCLAGYLLFGWGLDKSAGHASYRQVDSWKTADDQSLNQPFAITVDPHNGNVLVTDAGNQRVVIFNREGEFIRQFGIEGDGTGEFQRPTGIAVGPDGSIYVADYMQDRIQKFSTGVEFRREWGRTGSANTQFRSPNGLAVDEKGHVFVADFMNRVVKVFSPKGQFLRTVGHPAQWQLGDLDYPTDVEINPDGKLLVADAYNYFNNTRRRAHPRRHGAGTCSGYGLVRTTMRRASTFRPELRQDQMDSFTWPIVRITEL